MVQYENPRQLLKRGIVVFFFSSAFFFVDRLIKDLFGAFSEVCNSGISFGLFDGWGLLLAMVGISLFFVVIFSLGRYLFERFFFFGVGIFFAGGISNLLDRVYFGCVRDMFHFFGFFVFNISDVFLSVGAITMILVVFLGNYSDSRIMENRYNSDQKTKGRRFFKY